MIHKRSYADCLYWWWFWAASEFKSLESTFGFFLVTSPLSLSAVAGDRPSSLFSFFCLPSVPFLVRERTFSLSIPFPALFLASNFLFYRLKQNGRRRSLLKRGERSARCGISGGLPEAEWWCDVMGVVDGSIPVSIRTMWEDLLGLVGDLSWDPQIGVRQGRSTPPAPLSSKRGLLLKAEWGTYLWFFASALTPRAPAFWLFYDA